MCGFPILLSLFISSMAALPPTSDSTAAPKKKLSSFRRMVRNFSRVDTNYIEPQKYDFTVMFQNTVSFESYSLKTDGDHEVVLAPLPACKLGPYFGWRFIFLGYTIDIKQLKNEAREAFNLSLYAPQLGVDLFWRKSGNNYLVSSVDYGDKSINKAMQHLQFSGFETSERGINAYYIFNHSKFSYPAAYSQSTIQRRSAGSALAGISYSKHKLNMDWDKFHLLMADAVGEETANEVCDTTLHSTKISYSDLSIGGGYTYNWVFARNWLFNISLHLALGYKHLTGEQNNLKNFFQNFNFKNIMVDGVSRVGLVWNNMRWYSGASAVFHSYNYSKSNFSANTIFGNLYIYVGYNFGLKKQYRKKK